jgi:hypothetical protein
LAKIGAIARQKMKLEVMPIQSFGFVQTGVVNDEQSAFGVHSRYLLGQMIEVKLEEIGIDSVKNRRAAFSGGRTHRANNVGSDMVSEIRHFWSSAPSAPAPPRTRIASEGAPRRSHDLNFRAVAGPNAARLAFTKVGLYVPVADIDEGEHVDRGTSEGSRRKCSNPRRTVERSAHGAVFDGQFGLGDGSLGGF